MTRALSPKTLRDIRAYVSFRVESAEAHEEYVRRDGLRLIEAIDAALKPKKFLAPARKRKAAKLRSKKSETRDIRAAVVKRAAGVCECGCDTAFTELNPAELDHFHGRVRVQQSVQNTWLLRRDCHALKTRESPSHIHWLRRFEQHCDNYEYLDELYRVRNSLRWAEDKAVMGGGG